MSFYKKIESLHRQYGIDPQRIALGHTLSPLDILSLSGKFKTLHLKSEELLLVFKAERKITGTLTSQYVYGLSAEPQPLSTVQVEALMPDFSADEVAFIRECIALFTDVKQKMTKTLDDFLASYKRLVQPDELPRSPMPFFEADYLKLLSHEASEAEALCAALNQDARFVQALHHLFAPGEQALGGFKAEHLFLSDLIRVYNETGVIENEKARFTLAYYFEKLQGNDLARGVSVERLNEMVAKPAFVENIEKIQAAEFFTMPDAYANEYILVQILYKMQHEYLPKAANSLYRFATIVCKADGQITEDDKQRLKGILHKTSPQNTAGGIAHPQTPVPTDDSLEKVLEELNALVGLEEVKKSIRDLINYLKVAKLRSDQQLASLDISLHSVFLGPPGTGKTTVARLLGRIYRHLDYLSAGQLVETDRAGMVAGYVGQTALKVDELVKASLGGVLFIDEAYALTNTDNTRDFGHEAVDTLIKRMEDHRRDLVVVAAGYTEPMKFFIESNPGLRSRFSRYFTFDHFYPQQLLEIMRSFCRKYDFILTEEAEEKLSDTFELLYEKRDEGFGNARVVRNLFEQITQQQANRLVALDELSQELLQTITEADIPEPGATVAQVFLTVR
jgi:Holliday junction resolvasome RuvABC ATP-dependent DNA helicase subunit